MTDSGLPPELPDDDISSSAGPRPRVGAGDVSATPTSVSAEGSGGNDDRFWTDDGPTTTRHARNVQAQLRTLIEWVAVAVGALAVALLIKAFLLQAYYIPSESMLPTLEKDDRVLVNKLSYRVGDIQRGDIVVFARPDSVSSDIDDFIKRVIALSGETISFSDGDVFIDGLSLSEDYVGGVATETRQLIPACDTSPALTDTCKVPDGMVFVMGDNRASSLDSRFFGPIDEDDIVGRAFLKVWPIGDIGFL